MRDAWLPLGLVVLVGAAAPLACGQAFEYTGGSTSMGTGGGSSNVSAGSGGDASSSGDGGSTTSSTSTSTGTGGAKTCTTVAECDGISTLCGESVCLAGHCEIKPLQGDGKSFSQRYGDCLVVKCSKAQLIEVTSSGDVYDDGNACTDDLCDGSTPVNKPKTGSQCEATGVCDATAACVECTTSNTEKCDVTKPVCIKGYCSAVTCQDGLIDGTETNVDCGGGACVPCDDGKYCVKHSDCVSGVCEIPDGENKLKCIIASCNDTVKNGKESDTDCGGPDCKTKCPPNGKCNIGGDCTSGVCHSGKCLVETCNDGVKNGEEKGVDCGGGAPGCALKCPPP